MASLDETTIPALPCVSLGETLPFYQVLGFAVDSAPDPLPELR